MPVKCLGTSSENAVSPMENKENPQKSNDPQDSSLNKMSELFARKSKLTDTQPRPGFKEALQMRIQEAREQNRMKRSSFASWFQGAPARFAAAGTTALVVAIVAMLIFSPFAGVVPTVYAQDNFTLTAEVEDGQGIDARTSFLLESKTKITINDVKDFIKASVSIEPSFEQVSDFVIRITFDEPLPEGEVIQITLDSAVLNESGELQNRDYGWAFQVRDPFKVIEQIPATQRSNVPSNTGIEFTFSNENVSIEEFQRTFSISPEVEGRFEKERDTLIFVPFSLENRTVYTVTIDGSLSPDGSEDTLGETLVTIFETEATPGPVEEVISFYQDINHFAPGETIEIGTGYSREPTPGTVTGTFYKFTSADDYGATLKSFSGIHWRRNLPKEDILGSAAIESEIDATFTKVANGSGFVSQSLSLDGSLEKGVYALNVSGETFSSWTFVDVSDLAAYYATASNKQLVWVNDITTDSAVSGATVSSLFLNESTLTDAKGTVTLSPLSSETPQDIILIEHGDDVLAAEHNSPLSYYDFGGGSYNVYGWWMTSGDYWAHMYTDRTSYLPTDKIEVWGYLRDRDGMEDIRSVELILSNRGSQYNRVEVEVIDGFYRATIDTYNYQPEWYNLRVMYGDVSLSSQSLTILDYTKPAYELSVSSNAEVIKAGESVELDMHGAFFDGTPVKGLPLSVNHGKANIATVTLDGSGDAHLSHTPSGFQSGHLTQNYSFTIAPTRVEEGEIQTRESVIVLLTETYADADGEIDGTQGSIEFTTYQTDKEAVRLSQWNPQFDAKPGQTVKGSVTQRWSERIEEGIIYDDISKTTRPKYRFVQHEDVVNEFEVTTGDDAKARYTFEAPRDDAQYSVAYSVTDEHGAIYQSIEYLNRSYIERDAVGPLYFGANLNQTLGLGLGEELEIEVVRNQVPFVPLSTGSFLYFEAQRGIHDVTVSKEPNYTFTFRDDHVPDVYIFGVYFDGDSYAMIGGSGLDSPGGFHVPMDQSPRQLELDISAPETVRPGEDVKISVEVTDLDGNPVESQVNLSLVDEAYFALFPGYLDPLAVVYSRVVDGVFRVSVTRQIEQLIGGAEGGGGGGDEGRSDFKDTAAFVTIDTDARGHAEAHITLPDNLTSWRISAQAISLTNFATGPYAGHTIENIDATLPYFVVPVMKDSYLDGDTPQIVVRSAGTELFENDTVDYRMWIQGDDAEEQHASALSGETVRFDLPDLPPGVYGVTIDGESNGKEDRVTREVTILSSRIQVPVISTQDLEPGMQLVPETDGLTWIRFMDDSRGKLYGPARSLSWSYGDRVDQLLARNVANDLINREFDGNRTVENGSLFDYQDENGLIRLLPYAETNVELTAKVAFTDGLVFDPNSLRVGLNDLLDVEEPLSEEEYAWMLAGRAALSEPVLLEMRALLEETDEENLEVRLPLILGLYYIGATEEAREQYREITDTTKVTLARRSLDVKNETTKFELTSLLGILAAGLNEPQVDEYWNYLQHTRSEETTVVLEKSLMLEEWVTHLSDKMPTVEYTLHGERVKQKLENGYSDRIVLRPDEFAGLNLMSDGDVVVVTERFGGPEELEGEPTDRINMQREYRVNGQVTNTFKEGDLVEIRIKRSFESADFTKSTYELIDVLPSGLSLVSSPRSVGSYGSGTSYCVNWPRKMVDNRVTFFTWASYTYGGCDPQTTIYYARVVTPGTYEAEPAFLQSYDDPSTYTFSNASEITITE